ncbi:MAG: hypothetical protein ABII24_02305 [bacterium]
MNSTKVLLLVVIGIMVASIVTAGEITNTKLLLHATQPVTEESIWQTASWVIVPNFTSPSKAVIVAGPRYQAKDWWVETNVGALIVEPGQVGQRERLTIFDLRASFDALDPIHFGVNMQQIPSKEYWYTYLEVNYRLPFCLVGIETENDHPLGQDNLSIGPRMVLPLAKGNMVLVGSYQFHDRGEDQVWFRTVINF